MQAGQRREAEVKKSVFVHTLRFEKGRPRAFSVAVWKIVRGLSARPASMWGAELVEAWKAVGAGE